MLLWSVHASDSFPSSTRTSRRRLSGPRPICLSGQGLLSPRDYCLGRSFFISYPWFISQTELRIRRLLHFVHHGTSDATTWDHLYYPLAHHDRSTFQRTGQQKQSVLQVRETSLDTASPLSATLVASTPFESDKLSSPARVRRLISGQPVTT